MHVINAYFTVPRAGALCLLSAAEPTALQSVRCFLSQWQGREAVRSVQSQRLGGRQARSS